MTDYSQLTDERLIYACRDGDQAAWETLISRYERLVYTVPARYGLTQAEINDVFQSVWLALLKNLSNIRQPDRVSAWLVTTARRECWERRRGVDFERTVATDTEQLMGETDPDDPTPEEVVEDFENHQKVRDAVDQLDDRCQRLLWHLYYDSEHPSYKDVAKMLDIPIGSIGPLRVRCLRKLKSVYDKSSDV